MLLAGTAGVRKGLQCSRSIPQMTMSSAVARSATKILNRTPRMPVLLLMRPHAQLFCVLV
jgi:hypothetical protein